MAFFRKKNKKINITPTEISSTLSKLFKQVFKNNIIKHRDLIFKLTKDIYNEVEFKFGNGEVLIEDYYQIIKSHFPIEMGYLSHNFDEFFSQEKAINKVKWSLKVELKEKIEIGKKQYSEVIVLLNQEDWLLFLENLAIDYMEKSEYFFFFDVFKDEMLKIKQNFIKTSDEWFEFFNGFIKKLQHKDPRIVYFMQALSLRKKFTALLGIDWTPFVNIDEHEKENKFHFKYSLETKLKNVKNTDFLNKGFVKNSNVSNNINSNLNNKDNQIKNDDSFYFKFNNNVYKKITEDYFFNYTENSGSEESKKINFSKILNFVDLKNEFKITYLSEHVFIKNNALLKIDPSWKWRSLDINPKNTFELLNWTFLRAAIKLGLLKWDKTINMSNLNSLEFQNERNRITDDVIYIYQQLASLNLVLPPSLLREINKNVEWKLNKNFAYSMKDDYDDIQKVIFDSITTTKWTGSVFLDLSKIRKKGSQIRNGLRVSNGIKPYVDMLNNFIKTQGRIEDEKPISVALPIWHIEFNALFYKDKSFEDKSFDIEDKIDINLSKNSKKIIKSHFSQDDCLQRVALIPDYFMWFLYNRKKYWYLLDPLYFKDIDLNKEDEYLKIETKILNNEIKPEFYKKINLRLFFQKILDNKFSLIFNDVFKGENYTHNLCPLKTNGAYFNIGIKTIEAFKGFQKLKSIFKDMNIQILLNVLSLDFKLIESINNASDNETGYDFNYFVENFNKNRKDTNYLTKLKLKNEYIVKESLTLNVDPELCYIANVENPSLGCKKSIVTIFDKGEITIYHTPDFILFYHKNIVHHDVLEKVFLKQSPFDFEKIDKISGVIKGTNLGKDEFNFEMKNNYYLPFFKQGMTARCLNNYQLVISTWLKGVSGITLF